MEEVNGELSGLAEEGEIILQARRTLALRRALGHFGGHQSGWRGTANRLEDPTVQKAYLELSENMRNKVLDFLQRKFGNKKRTFLEWFWDTQCEGCGYRIIRDKSFCKSYCKRLKKIIGKVDENERDSLLHQKREKAQETT
jgi:hypothetical protein